MEKMEVVILTGLSGAGKTNAIDWFEDQNYYCVDNMPPSLIISFIDLTIASKKKINKAAFVVDIRGGVFFDDFKECIDELKTSADAEYGLVGLQGFRKQQGLQCVALRAGANVLTTGEQKSIEGLNYYVRILFRHFDG